MSPQQPRTKKVDQSWCVWGNCCCNWSVTSAVNTKTPTRQGTNLNAFHFLPGPWPGLMILKLYLSDEYFVKIGYPQLYCHWHCIIVVSIPKVLIHPTLNFFPGTAAYDKLTSILTAKLLLGDIKKLSPDAQTSCLEGFHATLNHWHPKMIGFSWLGSFCRYWMKIVALSLRFSECCQMNVSL